MFVNSKIMESFIKSFHIFNNVNITSKLCIIKVSPKSDMTIVWIDIWDSQNSLTAKKLVNQCFNISSYIITIREANMNSGVPQCKNCWKWSHITFTCHTFTCQLQGARCLKCNSSHKVEHYCHFVWCCKTNFKINPLYFKTKQSKPCPHSFKCINCKGNH